MLPTQNKKKAFTIIELVIVIAIVAILVAVLVPMFINVTKNAKLSADKQSVYDMNIALAADEAENGVQEDIFFMIDHMDGNYNFSNYHPLTKDYEFYWNKTDNRIVLFDNSTEEIIYPDSYAGKVDTDKIASTAEEFLSNTSAVYFSFSLYHSSVVRSSAGYFGGVADIFQTVLKDGGSITLLDDAYYQGGAALASRAECIIGDGGTLDLNGNTIYITSEKGYDGFYINGSGVQATIKNGEVVQDKTTSSYATIRAANGTLTLENMIITAENDGYALCSSSGSKIILINCIVNGNITVGSGTVLEAKDSNINGTVAVMPNAEAQFSNTIYTEKTGSGTLSEE